LFLFAVEEVTEDDAIRLRELVGVEMCEERLTTPNDAAKPKKPDLAAASACCMPIEIMSLLEDPFASAWYLLFS
jgi:hypothetical protein